jgi:hypothetical protein
VTHTSKALFTNSKLQEKREMNQEELEQLQRQVLQKTMLDLTDMGNQSGVANERKRIADLLRQNLTTDEADRILELLEIRER